ncbi:MAG: hypothetical protein HQL71_14075, partial [Magnetococcales bacterium]|nr:hypothetical protein [Magnetococcales bacterium]
MHAKDKNDNQHSMHGNSWEAIDPHDKTAKQVDLQDINKTKYLFKAALIGTATISLVFIIIIFGWLTYSRIANLQNDWKVFSKDASERTQILFHLKSALGYGGFIHNFKNYVMRQEPHLVKKIQHDLDLFYTHIDNYEKFSMTDQELKAIGQVRAVIDTYAEAFYRAQRLINKGITPQELDKNVRIDD